MATSILKGRNACSSCAKPFRLLFLEALPRLELTTLRFLEEPFIKRLVEAW